MSTDADKGPPPKAGLVSEENEHSSYAIPQDLSAALHKLIFDRLMKMSREVRRPGVDTSEEVGLDAGRERMPSAASGGPARSAQDAAQQDAEDFHPVATDD